MSTPVYFGEEEEKKEVPAHTEPPRTKPLATLHKDVIANPNDTEMDVLLPYFIDEDVKKRRKEKKERQREEREKEKLEKLKLENEEAQANAKPA